jgi:GntR family transcriptional regulator / MocR family aminotransferase
VPLLPLNRRHATIIEDDYDGEFRYDRRPIGSLQGLAPDRVVYAGTSSKSLAPALRLSWLVVPELLRQRFDHFANLRVDVAVIDQLALADFIERGLLDRQIRIMRKRYHDRSRTLSGALSSVGWLELSPVAAGLHVTATIVDDNVSEAEVLARTDAASVGSSACRRTASAGATGSAWSSASVARPSTSSPAPSNTNM